MNIGDLFRSRLVGGTPWIGIDKGGGKCHLFGRRNPVIGEGHASDIFPILIKIPSK